MDADRRHELKTNELAEALAKLRDFSDTRTLTWAAVIVAIALIYAGYKMWNWRQDNKIAQAFTALAQVDAANVELGDAPIDQLRNLIATNTEPGFVAAARLKLAMLLEGRALQSPGTPDLNAARAEYDALIAMPAAPISIKAPALFRLGKLYESERDFNQAGQIYMKLSQDAAYAGSPFKELAEQRLEMLDELKVPVEFEPGSAPLTTAEPAVPTLAPPALPTSAPAGDASDNDQP